MSENQTNSTGLTTKKKEQRSKTPKWIGRYQILGEAGRGATAFVYKAYDPQLDRHLAIKVLRQELANNDEYREAFLREAKLAAQLTHPGIVATYDVGIADNKPYIAMELLEGYTLQYILKTHGKVDIQQLLDMAEQLSRALAYAHKQGVVHRDLKPGNIIILNDKKTVKLTDFGIAHLDDSLGSEILQTDKVLGTPEYMAPEQLLGKPMDKRSDLYSFGVLLYQLILGKPPFTNTDLGLLFKQVIRDKPPILMLKYAIADENITDDLSDLVRKLLQKNPNKRYQTASDVAVELNAIQNKSGSGKIKSTKGFISLRLRWTAIMASVMFIAICISLAVVYHVQKQALSGITSDYGHSIARMIAFESSEAILLEDNIRLNVLVAESSKNEQLEN
ncbi:MAG: serine/threonine protein kinase, partial [Gammaproteobacteria bacterium]|nr:serine/threonine protein kinase [Gammaproteobacteria bacterium]